MDIKFLQSLDFLIQKRIKSVKQKLEYCFQVKQRAIYC